MMLGDYVTILRRRKLELLIPFALILAASIALAYTLPPVYRSEATILIERQEIPEELITTTVTGYVQEHVEGLKQQILTHDNLWRIANEFNLYPGELRAENRQEIVSSMEESALVEMVEVETSDPEESTQTSIATIAFTVSFAASSPEKAQQVAAKLSSLFLKKNREARVVHTEEVTDFLGKEAKRLSTEIAQYERKLAAFKQKNVNQLPELSGLNMKLYEQTEVDLERVEEEIQALETSQLALQSQLAITEPYKPIITEDGERLLTGSERLTALTAEYLEATSNYSKDHPDVIRLRQELESLEGVPGTDSTAMVLARLTQAQESLAAARQQYSEAHPDVQSLATEVASLEQTLRDRSYEQPGGSQSAPADPNNPAYVSVQVQLKTVQAELDAAEAERAKLAGRLAEYEQRLAQTPITESEYQSLARGYDNARQKYGEIKAKQLEAQLAEKLETGSKGQQFTLVQPAFLPSSPESPNRLGLALLGVLFAFSGGIGSVSLAEYMDRTIHGSRGLANVFQAPPLAVIPMISKSGSTDPKRRRLPAAA